METTIYLPYPVSKETFTKIKDKFIQVCKEKDTKNMEYYGIVLNWIIDLSIEK